VEFIFASRVLNPFLHSSVRRYRTIFVSDFHIGAKSFDARALLDFLKSTESEFLYLVGDIIDGWKLSKRWYWNDDITAVLDELVRKGCEGTKIFYIPGNHDEAVRALPLLRRIRFTRRMHITIKNKMFHQMADGRKMLVLHGDQFDRALFSGSVSRLSDRIYDVIMDIIGGDNHMTIVIDGKVKPFSLAKYLGKQGQKALDFINNFERAVLNETLHEQADGLICGHTHIPALKHIKNIVYANCGSWLRTEHTALVEDERGNLELLDWPSRNQDLTSNNFMFSFMPPSKVRIVPDSFPVRDITHYLIEAIRRTWPATQSAIETTPHSLSGMVLSFLNCPAAYQVVTQPNESNEWLGNQEGRNGLHVNFIPALRLKTLTEIGCEKIFAQFHGYAASNVNPAQGV
jgi:UDP-2,3-diacylglucosamine pyrophosphatase LpxH